MEKNQTKTVKATTATLGQGATSDNNEPSLWE